MASCAKCEEEIVDFPKPQPRIKCKFCEKIYHAKCAKMTNTVLSYFVSNRNYIWFCDNCVDIGEFCIDMHKRLDEMQKVISEHSSEINAQSDRLSELCSIANKNMLTPSANNSNRKRSYAAVSRNWAEDCATPLTSNDGLTSAKRSRRNIESMQRKLPEPIIIVKPKQNVEKSSVMSDIKQVINPISDPVKCMRDTTNGNIVITCKSQGDVSAIKQKLSSIDHMCDISERRKKRPMIKLVGISEYNQDKDELLMKLRVQNDLTDTSHEIEMVDVKEIKDRSYYTACIRTDLKTFELIMQRKRLFINWDSVKCYEHVNVLRCFKCSSYGHTAQNCNVNKEVCPKCSGSHLIKDCDSVEVNCPNCKAANAKFNLQLDINHCAWDRKCHVLNRRINSVKNRILYDE